MPFTLSHVAAIVPLARLPFSTPALVAGAVAPDVPYFARALPVPVSAQSWYEPLFNATTSHTVTGSLVVAVPYAVVLTVAWWVAERPVGALVGAPPAPEPQRRQRPAAAWVLLSVLVGIATHLLWDSFTHSDGYVVEHWSALSDPAVGGMTWARLVQHASTVLGLVVLAHVVWRARKDFRPRLGAVVAVAAVVAAGVLLGALREWRQAETYGTPVSVEALLRSSAEGAVVVLVGASLVFVLVWWAAQLRRERER
ncbi:uncharacterized BrkB/YihY/UPF0761 family membrane protein [Nocardioides cavernae]|uniref:Uncharacterized BrkB/YihY/UPF0761 family membrane protein n=1 Tax=Nocardioides cavernae TaxID=1921566 RepID=A0A7Y9H4B2_9ACTN|nr:DUF4184 family protein [Nocardioides cavernae]NYE37650.1 uncharacterized BrkB/YihY/UPF0761 family membrane protein [Nocardioides cavernae]